MFFNKIWEQKRYPFKFKEFLICIYAISKILDYPLCVKRAYQSEK